jgi:hypothetical protein
MKARHDSSAGAASGLELPAEAVLPMSIVSDRLHVLRVVRCHLEAEIAADRRYWRVLLRRLLCIYQEIEDCAVAEALAPHQPQSPQDRPAGRKHDVVAPKRARAKAA